MIPKAAWKELIDYLTEVTTNPMDFALTGKGKMLCSKFDIEKLSLFSVYAV